MKIIQEIINELIDKSSSLTDILIKTKVLAFQLKNPELKEWIDNELNGYQKNNIPEYRIVGCQLVGTISNGYQRASNYPIPLIGLDENLKKSILSFKLAQSISTLDDFVNNEKGGKLHNNIPAETYGFLSKDFGGGFVVEYATREIDRTQIIQVLTTVRTKLLDFILNINEEFGSDINEKAMTEKDSKEKIASLFNSSVFGNNTTIIVGDNNRQSVSNIVKGDFKTLEKLLLENGLTSNDTNELKQIIDTDNTGQEKEFGAGVKSWITKMINKAMDGTWQMSLGAAGGLLADGIAHYYGWK